MVDSRAKLDDRLPEVIEFAEFLKKEKGYTKVSIIGYCWGECPPYPNIIIRVLWDTND